MKVFRTPPAYDPIVRAEYHGNKYDVPRSWTERRTNWREIAGVIGGSLLVGLLASGALIAVSFLIVR